MHDTRILEELGISDIRICGGAHVANSDRIMIEFKQQVNTPFIFDDADKKSTVGKLLGKTGNYCGQMNHRCFVYKIDDAWREIQRRARAYQQLEQTLFEEASKCQ